MGTPELYPSDPTENDRIMTVDWVTSPMYSCTGLALVVVLVVVMYCCSTTAHCHAQLASNKMLQAALLDLCLARL